jgi:hypothetical protein
MMRKTNLRIVLTLIIFSPLLNSCNLFGKIDDPSGDEQILALARSCLNNNDFACAQEAYGKLSADYNDIKITEQGITTLAENGLFSIQDLITVLGTNTGSGSSIRLLAELVASRGKANAANRAIIQTVFASAAGIANSNKKAYLKFLSATAMFANTLGEAAGADFSISKNELSSDGTACAASATCIAVGSCAIGTSSIGTLSATVDLNTASDWTGAILVDHLAEAGSEASDAIVILTGSTSSTTSGIFSVLNDLAGLGALADSCARQLLLQNLY